MYNEKTLKIAGDNLITAEEVQEILLDYNIGKKPLAKLLGWGETTIIRYIEGDIPTGEYAGKLKMIKEEPNFYYDILLKNQDKLTNVAFKKSKKAVLSILMKSKQKLIAQYIINRADGEITASRVQYILYYSQILSLVLTGKELFEEESRENYVDFPYQILYENMRKNGIRMIDINMDFLNKKERDIIDCAFDTFEWYGTKSIRAMHAIEMMDYSEEKSSEYIMTIEKMKKEYKRIFEKYNVAHIKDFSLYVHKRMKEAIMKKDTIRSKMNV